LPYAHGFRQDITKTFVGFPKLELLDVVVVVYAGTVVVVVAVSVVVVVVAVVVVVVVGSHKYFGAAMGPGVGKG
jgi:hypothetical protein